MVPGSSPGRPIPSKMPIYLRRLAICATRKDSNENARKRSLFAKYLSSHLKRIALFPAFKMGGESWRHLATLATEGTNGDKNGDIPLPADLLRSDEFVPLRPEWESLDYQPLLEK